jgi:hypothetical protein
MGGIALSFIPPAESADRFMFVAKLIIGTVASVLFGLGLYYRGMRAKARDARASQQLH